MQGVIYMEDDNIITPLLGDETISTEEVTVMIKYYAILDVVHGNYKSKLIKEASQKKYHHPITKKVYQFSERTLYRYLKAYKEYGLTGLYSKKNSNKGKPKSIPKDLVEEILMLKKELVIRSSRKIINLLEISNKVQPGILKERTVSRLLKTNGYTKKAISASRKLYKKVVVKNIYELYMSDITEIWILNEHNKPVKAYLFVIIDTFSRFVVHAQFYLDSNLLRLEDCVKKAITKYGLCQILYVDNGSVYIANNFKLACANLGIKLVYSTVYYPQGKGLIERFNKTFKDDFYSELKLNPICDIRILNERFFAWLNFYHNKIHSSLDGKSPKEVWESAVLNGTKPKLVSPIFLKECFYHSTRCKVSAYGVVNFETNQYETSSSLVGEWVSAKYDPFDLRELYIYHNNCFVCTAKLIDLNRQVHSDYKSVNKDHKSDPVSGINYTELLEVQFKNLIKEQSLKLSNGNNAIVCSDNPKNEHSDTKEDIRPGNLNKDKKSAISLTAFIDTIAKFMDVEYLSYQQKDLLQKKYPHFKLFNADLLENTLNTIKSKYPDSSKNIIFYLDEIQKYLNN
jgi:transposase InsO family protein